MYTVVDIIDKIIEIDEKSVELYKLLQRNLTISDHARLVAGVFIREEERHINTYKKIKEEISNIEEAQIDFDIYDTISKIISAFKNELIYKEVYEVREILIDALDFKQKHLALVVRIQGLLVRKSEDVESISYKVLTRIIDEEKRHVEIIEAFLR